MFKAGTCPCSKIEVPFFELINCRKADVRPFPQCGCRPNTSTGYSVGLGDMVAAQNSYHQLRFARCE